MKPHGQIESFDQFTVLNPDTLQPARHQTQTCFSTMTVDLRRGAYGQPVETLLEAFRRDEDINRMAFVDAGYIRRRSLRLYFWPQSGRYQTRRQARPRKCHVLRVDGAWRGEAQTLADGWSAELFIPWSILSMPESDAQRRWRFLSREK